MDKRNVSNAGQVSCDMQISQEVEARAFLGDTSMHDSALHERLLDFTYGLILTLNRESVEDGEMTEEDLLAYAEEQIQSIEQLPTEMIARKLLEEIPAHYCGYA